MSYIIFVILKIKVYEAEGFFFSNWTLQTCWKIFVGPPRILIPTHSKLEGIFNISSNAYTLPVNGLFTEVITPKILNGSCYSENLTTAVSSVITHPWVMTNNRNNTIKCTSTTLRNPIHIFCFLDLKNVISTFSL